MGKTATLTWTLILLVLLPSGLMAWLGLRSAGALDASVLQDLRAQRDAELGRWRRLGPELRSRTARRVQDPLDQIAQQVAADLPGLPPTRTVQRLRRARSRLQATLGGTLALHMEDASGQVIYPAVHSPSDALDEFTTTTRAGLLDHLRKRADRAYYADGGEAAALAVWVSAAATARSRSQRAVFDVEAARVRARSGQGPALAAASQLDARYDEVDLVRVGRPALLLWLAACGGGSSDGAQPTARSADGSAKFAERLGRLVADGTVDATPLTAEERRRIGRCASVQRSPMAGDESAASSAESSAYDNHPPTRFRSAMPGGASLVVLLERSTLLQALRSALDDPARLVLSSGPEPLSPRRLWIEGLTDQQPTFPILYSEMVGPLPAGQERFRAAAQGVVELPLPGGGLARMHVMLHRWKTAYEASRVRRYWTIATVALLLVITAGGVFLIRRAILREREARRIRDDFIANVTHEVRTPLTSVLLHSELLIDEDDDETKRREHAAVVQAQGQRLAALVGDMLDFAALERGTRTLESVPVDLAAACRDAVAPYRVLAEREGADVTFVEPDGAVEAMADPAALARILGNLVGNAWKHGRPSRDGHAGRLQIVAREDGSGAVVEVRDDGPGIPAAEREQVFERFGRGRAAIRKEGSGIGLSLAKDLARAMGGDLTVHEDGGETVFRLRLAPVPDLDPDTPYAAE